MPDLRSQLNPPRSSPISLLAVHQGGGIGGAPTSLLKLLTGLDPAEFRAQALFTEPGPIEGFARELGVRASAVPTGGAFFYSAHAELAPRTVARFVRTFPSAVTTARRVLRERRPDVLHLNTSVLLAWGAAARRERVPVLWMVREVLGPNPSIRKWHGDFIRQRATSVVAISGAVRDCFPPSQSVSVVHNAVDLSEFDLGLLEQRSAVRAELGLRDDHLVVMAIGSVQREKGHWLLLESFQRLHARHQNARLVLVCGGVDAGYRTSLRGRVKATLGLPMDNLDALMHEAMLRGLGAPGSPIVVTGFRRDVARVLAAADVLAFPSLEPEGFGRPIIEAMAMQKPVVATDIGPSAELLGTEAGRLVRPDEAELTAALTEILTSGSLRERMGQQGRRRVEEQFSLDRQVAAMRGLYRQVAGVA